MRFLLFIAAFLFITNTSFAQGALSGKDLSTIKVDAMTEAEIGQIQQQLKQGGVSIDQVEQQAMAKGMSASEFAKLKARLANAKTTTGNKSPLLKKQSNRRNDSSSKKSDSLDFFNFKPINPLIYGSELFNQNNTGLSSNQNIATPLNYEIGPNDVLKLVVYGVQEYAEDITVSNEGRIQVQNVGPIKVAGLTIEAAIEKIKQQMANTAYPSIARGESKLALTLGDIRTIHVTVIGANKSGVHNVSSLSNVLSVLTEAGGPSEIGSYRQIELIRNNKPFKKIDLYQFMQNGDQSQNIGLKDNDVVRVPPYKNRIEIKGQIKRPGIFELIGNENFNQFLQYASGFDDTAYTAWVKIIQKNATIPLSELSKKVGISSTPCWHRIKKMEENKIKVSVEVTIEDDNNFIFNILAPQSLDRDMIRSVLVGGVALSIRAEETPKDQAKALRDVIDYLESEFINPDSFSDAQTFI